jgi:hypothetical protein
MQVLFAHAKILQKGVQANEFIRLGLKVTDKGLL